MKLKYNSTLYHEIEVPKEAARAFAATVIREHFGFKGKNYGSEGLFIDNDGWLCEGEWVCGHNRDWEVTRLKPANGRQREAWILIQELEANVQEA